MPSNSSQRFIAVQDAWFDVQTQFENDMAATDTKEQVVSVLQNYNRAESAYLDAAAAALNKNSAAVEKAFGELTAANKAVTKARKDAVGIATLIGKINKAANSAHKLTQIAN